MKNLCDFLTTSPAARRAGVSQGTIRYWADTGKLPFMRPPGGPRLFFIDDVDRAAAAARGKRKAHLETPETEE